jgi:hypothetical protein
MLAGYFWLANNTGGEEILSYPQIQKNRATIKVNLISVNLRLKKEQ